MKWFKHYSDLPRDEGVSRYLDAAGKDRVTAYGFLMFLLEAIASRMDASEEADFAAEVARGHFTPGPAGGTDNQEHAFLLLLAAGAPSCQIAPVILKPIIHDSPGRGQAPVTELGAFRHAQDGPTCCRIVPGHLALVALAKNWELVL